jgi:hypothetical protein
MIYQRCVWSTDEESCLLLFVRFGFRTLWVLSVCCRMKLEPGMACISLSPSEHPPISLPARGSRPRLQSSRRRVAVTRAAGSDRTLRTLLSKSCPRSSRSWRHRGHVRLSGATMLGARIVVKRRGWCGWPEGSYVVWMCDEKEVIVVIIRFTGRCLHLVAGFQACTEAPYGSGRTMGKCRKVHLGVIWMPTKRFLTDSPSSARSHMLAMV